MHGKGEVSKINGSICDIPLEAANICNNLSRPAGSIGLIVIKLKRDLRYRGHLYIEPVHIRIIHQALAYSKSRNKFYVDISVRKCLDFLTSIKFKEKMRVLLKKPFLMGQKSVKI